MRAGGVAVALSVCLAATACGSSGRFLSSPLSTRYDYVWQAAAHLSSGCARRAEPSSDSYGFLWARGGSQPLAYYLEDQIAGEHLFSSSGSQFHVWGGALWPCRTPVAMHLGSRGWVMTALASDPALRKTILVGRFGHAQWTIAPDGRFLFFAGQQIRYAGGRTLTVRGLPHGWKIGKLEVSPRNPSVFLANVNSPSQAGGGCRKSIEPGAVYLVTPRGGTRLRAYNQCTVGEINPVWSPDGRKMLWPLGADNLQIDISDGTGRHLRRLIPHASCGLFWSPNGREIAYGRTCTQIHVFDLATGRDRVVGTGELEGWSPDGKDIALFQRHNPWYGGPFPGGVVVAVPVNGGRPRLLIRVPREKTG